MTEEIVRLKNVFFSYGKNRVLEDINFSVKENEFLALMGPNGGGKSTLIKMILGLIKPDKGSIRVLKKEPPAPRKKIGYLAQYSRFDFSFPISVFDLTLMGRYNLLGRYFKKKDRQAAIDALKKVHMESFYKRHISELSGGQLQRVLIARAIVRNPNLLLLDEPMSSIDSKAQKSIYDILTQLNETMAIILITHDTSVVNEKIGSIACLNKLLYYHGPAEESLGRLAMAYECPVEVISHGIPHRVLKDHQDD